MILQFVGCDCQKFILYLQLQVSPHSTTMMYSHSSEEIALQLVSASASLSTAKFLEKVSEYDKQLIEWQKSQLQQKLAPQIRKQYKTYDDFSSKFKKQSTNSKDAKQAKFMFTNMIEVVDQKAYQYQKHDYQSIKKELQMTGKLLNNLMGKDRSQMEKMENSGEKQQLGNQGERQNQEWKIQAQKGEQMIPQIANLRGSEKKQQGSFARSNFASFQQQPQPAYKNLAPFLRPEQNPYDRHANSKLLKNKFDNISYNDRMRNIAAIVQTNKKQFDPNSFGSTFMNNEARRTYSAFKNKSGVGPSCINHQSIYNTSVNKDLGMSLNIGDVLKYTLGEKKQRQRNIKPEPIKNPFVRVPLKYSESLRDFYKAN